ncbi:response regulator transcription factor [Jeotgalibacillus proteolyticus]|uniref:response regulator transcription factor n=1 Tax=Jeotgalibacillus proteolyticus TaxID=2082395 RepID=UPI003CF1EB54
MRDVLIVDDEPMIREGLKTLIDWEEYGYRVVGLARNGRDGYEKFQQLKPDLIIADIKMPEMDGITLLETLRDESNNIRFILLSGYADFNYARRAISCGAEAYLLKPIDEDELIEKLIEIQSSFIPAVHQPSRSSAWKELFQHIPDENGTEAISIFEQKGIWQGPSRLLVVKPGRYLQQWQQRIDELVHRTESVIVFPIKDLFIFILPVSSHAATFLQELGESLPYHVAASAVLHQVQDSLLQWKDIQRVMDSSFYIPEKTVLQQPFDREDVVTREWHPDVYRNRLFFALEASSSEAAYAILDEVMEEWKARKWPEQTVKKEAASLCNQVMNKLAAVHPRKQSLLLKTGLKTTELYEASSMEAMHVSCKSFLTAVLDIMDDGTPDSVMNKMIDLIRTRYNENLRLETLAGIFNYNSAYLGKLFKSHTGEYFNTYVDKVRTEKAKEMLNKGYKVYEVAEKVGYANVDYFHRKFKKHAGVSPTAFKNKFNQ